MASAVATGASELLVRFKEGTPSTVRAAAHARAGADLLRRIGVIGYDLVRVPAGATDAVLAGYRADPAVAVAEPNHPGRIALSPADACHAGPCQGLAGQWHLELTNTAFGWDAYPGRTFTAAEKAALSPVTIAVLDTKIDTAHPDFVNAGGSSADAAAGGQLQMQGARDWIPASRWSGSAAYHGTFVAGLAAAAAGNGRGVAGTGYAAKILPLTVIDGAGNTDAATLADAIVYAWKQGARIINLSLGIAGDSQAVHDAIRTVTRGSSANPASLVVAAAGNNTGSAAFYPGSYPEVMSVSGTDASDRRATCSNYNGNVSVSAPADRLVGLTVNGGTLQAPCGTSAAAPQVSGLAAMLLMQNDARTPAQVRALIERNTDDLGASGRDDTFGHGRINIERALRAGDGPVTTGPRATVAGAGGTTTITAMATSATPIRGARVVFDDPSAEPVAVTAADGAFGGTTESLRLAYRLPAGSSAGAHPFWISAWDGATWGPAATGVVVVDGRAPSISGVTTSNAVRAAGQPLTVTFNIADDYSSTFTYGIEYRSKATGAIVHREVVGDVAAGKQTRTWMPSLNVPGGPFTVKIGVADQAGNAATTETSAVVT